MSYPAVVVTKAKGATLQQNPQKPYPPAPGPDEVLIKNVAVASNPKDWKLSHWGLFEGIEGNDVAGYIEAVGSNVKDFKKGDKVAALTKIMVGDAYGAYQTYSVSPACTTFPLGPRTSFEDASTLPLAAMTAAIGVFVRTDLVEPSPNGDANPKAKDQGAIVWGASSSVGAFAVQFVKKAGYYVIGIAGAASKVAKDLGCDVVLDYRSPTISDDIKSAMVSSKRTFRHAFDAHSSPSGKTTSYEELAKALHSSGGGALSLLLPLSQEQAALIPQDVTVSRTSVDTAYKEDSEFANRWFYQMAQWLEEGKFKPNEVKVIPGGLAGVKEGLRLMEDGKVSGEKLVYRIAETPATF